MVAVSVLAAGGGLIRMRVVLTANTSFYLWNFRRSTIEALLREGCQVLCLAPPDNYSPRLESLGARFHAVKIERAGAGPATELALLYHLYRLLRRERPDALFNFTIKMNLYCGLCARSLRIPYASNISGLGTAFIHDSWLYRQVRRVYGVANRGATRVFFQNPEDRDLFVSRGLAPPERTVLLPGSGVDTRRFAFSPLPDGIRDGHITFLMIARLIADKGVREYVEAARRVRAAWPTARFLLLGPGKVDNRSAISDAEIAAWQEEGIVEWQGEQTDVLPFLQQCHVLVLPSYREGMPRTVLEAASVGRPAVVSDVPGCRHSVEADRTGWLCRARDAGSLAAVMMQVLEQAQSDPQWLEAFGERAAQRARREFSEAIVVQAYLDALALMAPPGSVSRV
ncbi:MAG: glycosyltransferase family 4 protein [Pseudohongiellaceae bacterium]